MKASLKSLDPELLALDTMVKLVRAGDSLLTATKQAYLKAQLSESQFGVLEALLHIGPMSQKDLAKKLLKSKGNMTMVISHLKKRKLVTCESQAGDKRFLLVQLTSQGRDLIKDIFPRHAQGVVRAMAILSCEEQRQLGQLCKKLGLSLV